jgi:hypothetical protein
MSEINLKVYSHIGNFKVGEKINRCDTYVKPMLGGINPNYVGGKLPQNCYRNCFLGDTTQEGYESGYIMLLYRLPIQLEENVELWMQFEKTVLLGNKSYRGDYKVDKYHQMYVFDVPDEWKDDYKLFLEWKPSKFSDKYKQHIIKFYNIQNGEDALFQVLYKNTSYGEKRFRDLENQLNCSIPREQESSSYPYWEIEHFQEDFKYKETFEKVNNGREESA